MTNKPKARTKEEKIARVKEVMRMSSAGFNANFIERRTGTQVYKAREWAKMLGIEWTGKPEKGVKA